MSPELIIVSIGLWGLMIGIWVLFFYTVWHDRREDKTLNDWLYRRGQ